jgi:acetyl/propionyl-CoA carboxylase alpha subunit
MTVRSFHRVLVANRGEIAVRVLRGVRELGLTGIAVYSEADRGALHLREAAVAVPIGPAPPSESYLSIDRILAAARETGAEAIHPGYGFLSENAGFARACRDAGLIFIGPSPEAMERLGSKRVAKATARAAGVPVVPGYEGDADTGELAEQARRIGFPLLVKASAGGGGRGMRIVAAEGELADAVEAARREAVQAFGDGTLLLEKLLRPARHIEVQVMGDAAGNAVALGERECSVQRRHQKLFEESPSPAVGTVLRADLESAAVALAKHVGYASAGTVEFLVDETGAYYFLEVNTRLQVEHPVTELVTGLDLVHLQIAVAMGRRLEELLPEGARVLRGHALEARVCAEDPEHGFLPAAGRLLVCDLYRGPGVRVDTGFEAGSEVPLHYDSLLAKVIVHAPNRAACLHRMQTALQRSAWLGLPTNADFLLRVVRHPAFAAGKLRTDFLDVHPELLQPPVDVPREALAAAALFGVIGGNGTGVAAAAPAAGLAPAPRSPWGETDGFRTLHGGYA